jgi:L-lactate dehydrogenase complex protein LldG
MVEASRNAILQSLRTHDVQDIGLPDLDQPWTQYDNPVEQFIEAVKTVGGTGLRVRDVEELNAALQDLPVFSQANKIASCVDGVRGANVDLTSLADPHEAEDIDFLVAAGDFGVAENGAVWVTGQSTPYRVLYFITQHLALVVQADQIVNNLHEAYARLAFQESGFGLFLSGPSKTADIEQSLVIGAHGARSLTVFCMG